MKIFFTEKHHKDENYIFCYKLIAIYNIFYKNKKVLFITACSRHDKLHIYLLYCHVFYRLLLAADLIRSRRIGQRQIEEN